MRKIEVSYMGSEKSTKFDKEKNISDMAIYEIIKPSNSKPSSKSSALASAETKVEPPPKDKTSIQELND